MQGSEYGCLLLNFRFLEKWLMQLNDRRSYKSLIHLVFLVYRVLVGLIRQKFSHLQTIINIPCNPQ